MQYFLKIRTRYLSVCARSYDSYSIPSGICERIGKRPVLTQSAQNYTSMRCFRHECVCSVVALQSRFRTPFSIDGGIFGKRWALSSFWYYNRGRLCGIQSATHAWSFIIAVEIVHSHAHQVRRTWPARLCKIKTRYTHSHFPSPPDNSSVARKTLITPRPSLQQNVRQRFGDLSSTICWANHKRTGELYKVTRHT